MTHAKPFALLFLVSSAFAACRGDLRSNPLTDLMAESLRQRPETRVPLAFRLPAEGGPARIYRVPALSEHTWSFDWETYKTNRAVGYSAVEELVYALAEEDALVALDLETGRMHLLDSNVTTAFIDPTDRVIVVRRDGSIGHVDHRTVVNWADTLPAVPTRVWGAARGRILAVVEQDSTRELLMLQPGHEPVRQAIPAGPMAAAPWGDLVAVAADSGLVTIVPEDPSSSRFLRLPGPRLIAFSTSGHQIYLVIGNGTLVMIDRFDLIETHRVRLPGRAADLRGGPKGEMLLVRQESIDSLWIVRLGRGRRVMAVAGSWSHDLPAVAPDGSVLLRQGDEIVALTGAGFRDTTATPSPERDSWLVTAWEARQPAHQIEVALSQEARPTGQVFYVQVSSSRNPVWAEDFARKLRVAGMDALVLQPDVIDELYHVVMGPYPTRPEAETVGRSIGLPFWIVTREAEPPPP